MTEMQAQFEEWFKQSHTGNVQKVNGEYVHGATERLWQAWQAAWTASRAGVVVKLPKYHSFDFDYSALYDSLDELGVSYE